MAIIGDTPVGNPFNFNDPTPPDKFWGRWDTVDEIAGDLCAAQGSSHAIIAGKRCGKTSLLYTIQDRLIKRLAKTDLGERHVLPVFIDVLGLENKSPFDIYKGLIKEVRLLTTKDEYAFGDDPILSLNLDAALLDNYYGEDAPESGFDEFKKALGHIASKAKDKFGLLRFVFLIDEVEEISEKSWTNELFGHLRSLTTHPRTSGYFRLVMAGSQRFLRAQRRPGSTLLNMFKRHHPQAFSDDVTRELITEGGGVSDIIAEEVIRLSGGHPYLVQFLMHYLWDKREMANVDDLQAIGRRLYTQHSDIINDWFKAIAHPGQCVYMVLSEAKQWMKPQTIREAITEPGVEADEGLTVLLYHNLIIQHSNVYKHKYGSELFRQWFLARRGIESPPPGIPIKRPQHGATHTRPRQVDLAIVTAMPEELEPLLNLTGGRNNWKQFTLDKFLHYHTSVKLRSQSLAVVACSLWKYGANPTTASILRLQPLRPRLIAMTGICAGWEVKRINFGDVIVADRAFRVHEGKESSDGFQPDTQTYQPVPWLMQWLRNFSANQQWFEEIRAPKPLSLRYQVEWVRCRMYERQTPYPMNGEDWEEIATHGIDFARVKALLFDNRLISKDSKLTKRALVCLETLQQENYGKLEPSPDPEKPSVHYGVFASTDAIIAVENPFHEHAKRIRKVLAIELEVASLFSAAAEIGVPAFAVKGVSDYGTLDKDDRFHIYAAEASACWMYAFIRYYGAHLLSKEFEYEVG